MLMLALFVSCSESESEEEAISFAYGLPEITSTDVISFNFGQSKTFAAQAANVDYLKVIDKPNAWTVVAVNDKVQITAPPESETSLEVQGTILIRAFNRTLNDSLSINLSVSIDVNAIQYSLAFSESHSDTEYFEWGETKSFPYVDRYVKDITARVSDGWIVAVNEAEKRLTVTAPSYNASSTNVISGQVDLSATPVTDAENISLSLSVAIPAYRVNIGGLGDDKLYAVYDNNNQGLAIISKEHVSFDDELTVLYVLNNNSYTDGYVFENGGKLTFADAAYEAGTASAATELTFAYDGAILKTVSGNVRESTISPYTVSDAEGNAYPVVKGGTTFWTDRNIKSRKAPDNSDLTFYFPGGIEANAATQGLLYNKTTAINGDEITATTRGICPQGWHVPSTEEFEYVVANPYRLYSSLATNFGGLIIIYSGNPLPVPTAGSYTSTGRSYGVAPSISPNTVSIENAGYTNASYHRNLRCVKDIPPFVK
jgi:hypothetical protein